MCVHVYIGKYGTLRKDRQEGRDMCAKEQKEWGRGDGERKREKGGGKRKGTDRQTERKKI